MTDSTNASPGASPAIDLRDVRVWTPEGFEILRGVTWRVERGEHWALLGPNGSGKTTLLSLASAMRHPSAGSAAILGSEFGKTDLLKVRKRIGIVDTGHKVLPWLKAEELVMTGFTASIRPLWERYGPSEEARAREMLAVVGCETLVGREIGACSHGERQRALVARALVMEPELLLLDEPAGGLDLPAREALIGVIDDLVAQFPAMTTVLVTHHLEELPPTTTHAILLGGGEIVAAGPATAVLTSELVSASFGIPVVVESHAGRWLARAEGNWQRVGARRDRTTEPVAANAAGDL